MQLLDLGVFGIVRRFESNFRNDPLLSYQSNQILKIQSTLSQASIAPNCIKAFNSAGIVTDYSIGNNNEINQFIRFDVTSCTHIRSYQIEYIQGLIENHQDLTSNQQLIYNRYNQPNNNQQNTRLPLQRFQNLRNNS